MTTESKMSGTDEISRPLSFVRDRLKQGDYDGVDIMHAWLAIDELTQAIKERDEAYERAARICESPEAIIRSDQEPEENGFRSALEWVAEQIRALKEKKP